jgi:hypothetical protein
MLHDLLDIAASAVPNLDDEVGTRDEIDEVDFRVPNNQRLLRDMLRQVLRVLLDSRDI